MLCRSNVLLTSSGELSFFLIILPSPILKPASLEASHQSPFILQKTAPAGPPAVFHEVASHTCLFHASFTSSCHCSVRTACAQKHVTAHAGSCSISKLLISRKSESETERFFPGAPIVFFTLLCRSVSCLRLWISTLSLAQQPQNFVGSCGYF